MQLDTLQVKPESCHMTNSAQPSPSRPKPGVWLMHQMERKQLSARQLADTLGIATQTVYSWQNGKTTVNEDRVPRLASVLGISEVEARRGLGYWTPEDSEPQPVRNAGELDEILGDLTDVLERFRRWRSEG